MSKIKGISYGRKQAEYQYFPEEYFSGSDVTIYFNDVFADDIIGMEFTLQERLMPVYGYNSFTFDSVGRGQRIVQGSFTIAFKESGYLYNVLEHLGRHKNLTKPAIAYYLADAQNSTKPEWAGNVNETIEGIVNREAGYTEESYVVQKAPTWPQMYLGHKTAQVKELQQFLLTGLPAQYQGKVKVVAYTLTSNMKRTNGKGYITKGPEVKKLKARLNAYLFHGGYKYITKALDEKNDIFDTATEAAVKQFQKYFSKSLAVDGIVGDATRGLLSRGLTTNGTYDAPTKLAVLQFQKAAGVKVDGIYQPTTMKDKIQVTVTVSTDKLAQGSEMDMAEYEADIWGDTSVLETDRSDNPFFYGAPNQRILQAEGFDIYINYGPLPEAVIQDGKVADYLNFSNTVKALRNVQIGSVTQVLSPTGEPIAERYSFLAKDLD